MTAFRKQAEDHARAALERVRAATGQTIPLPPSWDAMLGIVERAEMIAQGERKYVLLPEADFKKLLELLAIAEGRS